MSKVLVTGGTGFLGRHLVDALVGAGHDVVSLVYRSEGVSTSLSTGDGVAALFPPPAPLVFDEGGDGDGGECPRREQRRERGAGL